MKLSCLLIISLLFVRCIYGQGLTYGNPDTFRESSTPDSLYKEGKFHLRAGIALTITGPVELGAGLFFMVSSGIGKDRTSTGLIGLGSALCIIGAVSTVLGPIAINRGRKEIKLGRKQLAPTACINMPSLQLGAGGNGSQFCVGLGMSATF